MLQINSDTKIFIYCPAGVVTGGAELLHQLCDVLNRNGRNAYIVYFGDKSHEIPHDYEKYQIELSNSVIDESNNVIVLYEGIFEKALLIKKAQILFWWLSVDHFFITQTDYLSLRDYYKWNPKYAFKVLFKRMFSLKNRHLSYSIEMLKKRGTHAYQSEYAKDFLLKQGIKNLVSLKDYINLEYLQDVNFNHRENIILYNPKKGIKFTLRLMAAAPELNWTPIQDMSRKEVLALMRRSKLYIDFGYHPGKDRLPREAAINGCCIITGKRGSAGFHLDVPISDNYKFNQNSTDVKKIITCIHNILDKYNSEIKNFEFYRSCILKEKDEFNNDTLKVFNIHLDK